jgi:hypothetical protein
MTRVRLSAVWPYRDLDRPAESKRLLRLVDLLRPIHPLLEEFSWFGRRSGWRHILAQSDLRQASEAHWNDQIFKSDGGSLVLAFWNRRKPIDEFVEIVLSIWDLPPNYPYIDNGIVSNDGGIRIAGMPDALVTEPILNAILEAFIIAMEPYHAEIGTAFHVAPSLNSATFSELELSNIRHFGCDPRRPDWAEWNECAKQLDGGIDTPVWRAWLREGQAWPRPGTTWLEPWQSEPADAEEPLLGGTLYTWHKYTPWNLPAEANWERGAGLR